VAGEVGHGLARHGWARRGRHGMAWQGKAGAAQRGSAGRGMASQCLVWQGKAGKALINQEIKHEYKQM